MKRQLFQFGVVLLCLTTFVSASSAAVDDVIDWLDRMAGVSEKLNYSGTFIYQSGPVFETSRIIHIVDESGEHDRLEVLDGSPREIIKDGEEVRCVLPDQKIIIIDQAAPRRGFPARLTQNHEKIAQNYKITIGGESRIAGVQARQVKLEPRDHLRYGQMIWVNETSGLLLKAKTLDEEGNTLEQFMFSDVRFGEQAEHDLLTPRHALAPESWKVIRMVGEHLSEKTSGWRAQSSQLGYELKSVMRRPASEMHREALHFVFSDGLSAVSVFIEHRPGEKPSHVRQRLNPATNLYMRMLGDDLITVLGEAPMAAVQRIGDSMEPVASQ